METLPPEMVEEVGQYLTLRDLSSCIAVSRRWRDTFNNDSLWQQHCDPSLAEPLEKTPCVVEPRFVSPEVDNSTLTPISYWRMAFLREQHLWGNWKNRRGIRKHIFQIDRMIGRDFLSDTLLVRYSDYTIQIWNVSTGQARFITSITVEGIYYYKAYRTNRLLVSHRDSVKVFHMDPSENNVIELLHDIAVDSHERTTYWCDIEEELNCVNGTIYIHVNANRQTMDVIDLERGMKIKTEPCPVMRAHIVGIKSHTNSEFVIVIVGVPWRISRSIYEEYQCYVYSVGQLVFSSGLIVKMSRRPFPFCAINSEYLAVSDNTSLKIYNCHTSELVLESLSFYYDYLYAFNDGFVCLGFNESSWIRMFSLTSKTKTKISISLSRLRGVSLEIINNKFIRCIRDQKVVGVWEASDNTLKRSEIQALYGGEDFNESFTRVLSRGSQGGNSCMYVYYYW